MCWHPRTYWWWIQLSDFGLAITDGSQSKKNIKLSGTLGYVAPEYLLDGMPTKPVIIIIRHMHWFDKLDILLYCNPLANQIQEIVS